jgi:hypothetical protein
MNILVFLHGTTIMHKAAANVPRKERVKQVICGEQSVYEFDTYIPVGNAVKKLNTWVRQGAKITYLSSQRLKEDVEKDEFVLNRYEFPAGEIYYRKDSETYGHVVSQILPDVLIEDDCESIGGEPEMTYPNLQPELKQKIKSILVKEFEGIDNLPDDIEQLHK